LPEQLLKEQTSAVAQPLISSEVQSTEAKLEQPEPKIMVDLPGDAKVQSTSSIQQPVENLPTQSSHVDGNIEDKKPFEGTPRVKMGGPARKRFRFLLKQGYSRIEAREMALLPMKDQPHRREDVSLFDRDPKKIKISEGSDGSTPPLETNIKIAIVSTFYPNTLLTQVRLKAIESDILDKVVKQSSNIKPKFNGITFRDGYLEVTCADKPTADWLKQLAPTIKPWRGAALMAIHEENIPQVEKEVLIGFFPNSLGDTSEKIMDYIAAQNEGIDISKWNLLSRHTDQNLVNMSFTVDPTSFQNLKNWGYKINYKFGQVQMKLQGNPRKAPR